MKLYDQHLHTFLSSDTDEPFENYIKKAMELNVTHFVTTEHLDLSSKLLNKDDIPDLELQDKIIRDLNNKYPKITFLKGIELGYKFSRIKDIEDIVKKMNFDVVVMSIHESEEGDCIPSTPSAPFSNDDVYDSYLDLYINMLENISCYNIVGHIDFVLRYIGKIDINSHKEKLTALLKLVISKEKALEFNTRFIYQYDDSFYLKNIFELYYQLGGKKISLGSDAHSAHFYFGGFNTAISVLKNIGFTHVSTFQKGKEKLIKM